MLPGFDDVVRAAHEVDPSIALRPAAVRQALRAAEHLVHDALDVPAALHFVFSREPRTFSARAAAVLARLLEAVETAQGLKILAPRAELERHLATAPGSLDQTRDWFAGRVVLHGG